MEESEPQYNSLYDLENAANFEKENKIADLRKEQKAYQDELEALQKELLEIQATGKLPPLNVEQGDRYYPGEKELRQKMVALDQSIGRIQDDINFLEEGETELMEKA